MLIFGMASVLKTLLENDFYLMSMKLETLTLRVLAKPTAILKDMNTVEFSPLIGVAVVTTLHHLLA